MGISDVRCGQGMVPPLNEQTHVLNMAYSTSRAWASSIATFTPRTCLFSIVVAKTSSRSRISVPPSTLWVISVHLRHRAYSS
jgi:hypothetical protein